METKQLIVPTEDEMKKFYDAFWRTFNAIADDGAFRDNTPKRTIAEVVLDASYVKSYGGLTPELYKKFDDWVKQEVLPDYEKGLRKMVKFFWTNPHR